MMDLKDSNKMNSRIRSRVFFFFRIWAPPNVSQVIQALVWKWDTLSFSECRYTIILNVDIILFLIILSMIYLSTCRYTRFHAKNHLMTITKKKKGTAGSHTCDKEGAWINERKGFACQVWMQHKTHATDTKKLLRYINPFFGDKKAYSKTFFQTACVMTRRKEKKVQVCQKN